MASKKIEKIPCICTHRTVTLPRDDENDVFVAVGGVAYQVPRGKPVQVPQAVQEVLMRSRAQRDCLNEYIDRHAQ